ncbi:MAG TPA: sigma-70 family RNA polymerase sigma factor [Terracidiphilus sp.]|nr:sigma-70 family RNA polymerase sigma factor [Terracidiphilus sp.]
MRAPLNNAITLLRSGDPESIGEALSILQGTVFAFSMKVCGHREDAEDTMQEVLSRSLPHLSKIEDPRALAAWLYKVTRNRCWRSRRRVANGPTETLSLDELMPDREELLQLEQRHAPHPEEHALRSEETRLLHKAVLQLPAQYRMVLVLHDMEELDTDLVARVLNLQPGTVRVRLHRARLGLRKIMARPLEELPPSRHAPHSVGTTRRRHRGKNACDPQCRAIFARLSEYLDYRLAPPDDAHMRRHMEACPACVTFLADLNAAIDRCRRFEVAECGEVQTRLGALFVEEYLRLTASQDAAAQPLRA